MVSACTYIANNGRLWEACVMAFIAPLVFLLAMLMTGSLLSIGTPTLLGGGGNTNKNKTQYSVDIYYIHESYNWPPHNIGIQPIDTL
jgi:hypothetical protein